MNAMNETEESRKSAYVPETVAYVNASISLFLVFVVLIGNSIIILIYVKFKKVRDLNNTAVTILSICDLLRGGIVMTTKIYNQYSLSTSLIEPLCTTTALTSAFSFVFNPQLLALIALIRYRKIAPGIIFQLSRKKFFLAVLVLVIITSSFALLPIFGVGQYDYSISHGVCFTDWSNKNRIFRTIFYVIVIGIAFPVLTVSYSMLYIVIRKHNTNVLSNYNPKGEITEEERKVTFFRKIKTSQDRLRSKISNSNVQMSKVSTNGETTPEPKITELQNNTKDKVVIEDDFSNSCMSSVDDSNYDHSRMKAQHKIVAKHISKQEYQVTKLMIMIFIAYCVCWMPAAIYNVIALIDPNRPSIIWSYIIVTMVELKSALNPIIYGLGNRKYRRAFKKIVKKYCVLDIN